MKKFVITIGREYGSGGRIIGEKLAKRLGVNFYDKNMIDKIAEESGFTKEAVEALDGKKTSSFLYSLFMSTQPVTLSDTLFKAQTDIIRDLVSRESCVIVGRCADYVLSNCSDCGDVINAFIYADMATERKCQRKNTRTKMTILKCSLEEWTRQEHLTTTTTHQINGVPEITMMY